jgi:enoyl-CoA hydratase/carnithine racemase
MGEKGIDYIERDNIGIIILNRPDVLNAVDLETAQHLREAVITA